MTWHDAFLDELLASVDIEADQLAEVVQRLDPAYATILRDRERTAARERGRALLLAHLNDTQRATFEDRGRFHVVGSEGGHYCIHLGREANVWPAHPDGEHAAGAWCIHVRDRVPDEDNVLAQCLMLENNEPAFRRLAGR